MLEAVPSIVSERLGKKQHSLAAQTSDRSMVVW